MPLTPPSHLPAVIGHRGAMAHAPENTLASFRKAASLGARWVEFDVTLTKGHHPVIFHDETFDRLAGIPLKVADAELADVMHVDVGAWFGSEFRGQMVPTLAETITVLEELGLGANIEIKPTAGVEQKTGHVVATQVRSLWPASLPAPLVSSFSETALAAAFKCAPQIDRAFLVHRPDAKTWHVCKDLACVGVHVNQRFVTPRVVKQAHARGLPIRAYTVNTPARAAQLFDWGLDGVFSDQPERIIPLRR